MTNNRETPEDAPTEATETPHSESEAVRKDTAYSPGSETETQRKQESDAAADADPQVKVAPGTGGPDDVGDVDVDREDINLSGS